MPNMRRSDRGATPQASLDALAELQGIRLSALELKLMAQVLEPPYDLDVVIKPSAEVKGASLRYDVQYSVSSTKAELAVLSVSCTYQVSYSLPEDAPIDRDEIKAFGSTTVLTTLHPYVRELLADVSARAGLPSITLGSIRP